VRLAAITVIQGAIIRAPQSKFYGGRSWEGVFCVDYLGMRFLCMLVSLVSCGIHGVVGVAGVGDSKGCPQCNPQIFAL